MPASSDVDVYGRMVRRIAWLVLVLGVAGTVAAAVLKGIAFGAAFLLGACGLIAFQAIISHSIEIELDALVVMALVKVAQFVTAKSGASALRAVDLDVLTAWNIIQTHIFSPILDFSQRRGYPLPPVIFGIMGLARNSRQNPHDKEVRYQNP